MEAGMEALVPTRQFTLAVWWVIREALTKGLRRSAGGRLMVWEM
jgi:hypothetical protein